MAMENMRPAVASMLRGIDRYNPENLPTLERYVEIQAQENAYDLEANLAVLKLYQFNPGFFNEGIVCKVLLKALTNLPHTDFVLCKCFIDQAHILEKIIMVDPETKEEIEKYERTVIGRIMEMQNLLEACRFKDFWIFIKENKNLILGINGFQDSIRKFVCHVVNITYQHIEKEVLSELLGGLSDNELRIWMDKYGWREVENNYVFIGNQEENIKTKNITEKIEFDSVAAIMAAYR